MRLRPHVLRAAAAAAVFAPFALSVAAHAVPDRPRSAPASERPALRFGEHLVNLGRLPEGATAQGVFRFTNAGESPLTILDLEPSCGCLKPDLPKETYAPGESGMFVVTADTTGEGSDRKDSLKQHYVEVRYDAGGGPETARVHLKFVLPARRIVVEPSPLLVYQFSDEPVVQTVTVTDRRAAPATVTAVECGDAALTVEPSFAESADDPTRATIVVTVPGSLDRDVRTLLTIRTDDPQRPEIKVPVAVRTR
ncbi:MAG TPA: DUF1573 domain-containing protein, partial [Planctomycetaceae bacterium]